MAHDLRLPPDMILLPAGLIFDKRYDDESFRAAVFSAWFLPRSGRWPTALETAEALGIRVARVRSIFVTLQRADLVQTLRPLRPDALAPLESPRIQRAPRPSSGSR